MDDGARWIVGFGAGGVFGIGGERHAEEDDGAEAFGDEGGDVRFDAVEAAAVLVGEGGDGGFFAGVVGYEEGIDEGGLWGKDVRICGGLWWGSLVRTLVNWRSACHVRVRGWL